MKNGEPDINRLLGAEPTAAELTGAPRRQRRTRQAPDVTPIPDSAVRLRILNRLSEMHQAADESTEQLVQAMISVLDYHRPWRREVHVIENSVHAGEQHVIAGCRSCSWSYRTDCPTVMAVAHKLGLTQL